MGDRHFNRFREISDNFRPTQPLNGRQVYTNNVRGLQYRRIGQFPVSPMIPGRGQFPGSSIILRKGQFPMSSLISRRRQLPGSGRSRIQRGKLAPALPRKVRPKPIYWSTGVLVSQ